MIIAVDGPSGSGKSTVSKALAKRLGIHYADTGAMYRALALAAARAHISPDQSTKLIELARCFPIRIDNSRPGQFDLCLGEENINEAIRHPDINKTVSLIAKIPEVRAVMVKRQRSLAKKDALVMEGRDITTVVFPNADFKFFLDADPRIRAERRWEESRKRGVEISVERVEAEQAKRDETDRTRASSPLRVAADAVRIDTTRSTVEEVVSEIIRIVNVRREPINLFYSFCRSLLWMWCKIYFRLKVYGADQLPKRGGFILASNHRSFLDPILISVSTSRQVSFLARDTLFRNWFFSLLIKNLNAHPIRRASADRSALRLASHLLITGNPVLMFPEGTRSLDGNFLSPKAGLGYLVAHLGCPVVPVFIKGSFEAFPKNGKTMRSVPISVMFGKPVYFQKTEIDRSRKYFYQVITQSVMEKIKSASSDPRLS